MSHAPSLSVPIGFDCVSFGASAALPPTVYLKRIDFSDDPRDIATRLLNIAAGVAELVVDAALDDPNNESEMAKQYGVEAIQIVCKLAIAVLNAKEDSNP